MAMLEETAGGVVSPTQGWEYRFVGGPYDGVTEQRRALQPDRVAYMAGLPYENPLFQTFHMKSTDLPTEVRPSFA